MAHSPGPWQASPGGRLPEVEARRKALLQRVARPWWRRHGDLLRYLASVLAYAGICIVVVELFASWLLGLTVLAVVMIGLPGLLRWLR